MKATGWSVGGLAVTLAIGLGLMMQVGGCADDLTPCTSDFDCIILCECAGLEGTITIGPYPCQGGTCGQSHASERDCSRVCTNPPAPVPDDDDSASDDDDSASDDDDSAGSDDDDSGAS